ncbi:hypothetical protein [Legionella worsleiensis]|uniref:VirK protein n=1 Tax=Legionella worsleiensis TaxID=45076 RepID=A0A0W1AJV4_9GAMM|nr:hypothetical protein [Legionella worsleiensis]KTD81645.1 hypothetical protein Lwor_0427 [Legionella worsleiensis]STY31945.1 Uncharacterised protein [Legionella worsleiensis]
MLLRKITSGVIGIACCISSLSVSANNKLLASYDELLQTLDSGNKVRAVVHVNKCTLIEGTELAKVITMGFNYDWYNHYNLRIDSQHSKEVITTSKNIFSVTQLNALGSVNNYVQLHIFKDNSAYVFGAIIDPVTYEQKITATYSCPLDVNSSNSGIVLYAE